MILEFMAADLGVPTRYLAILAQTASKRYKVYTVPKKTHGTRTICHPAKELKALQRWLVRRLFAHLPIHSASSAYSPGNSIAKHARQHAGYRYTLRLDFVDFFPSITSADVETLLRLRRQELPFSLDDGDVMLIAQMVCRDGALTIGAPSSPIISNAVLYDFDAFWSDRCDSSGVMYTRYADDIYCSTDVPNSLQDIPAAMSADLARRLQPRLTLNAGKTRFTSRKNTRRVTGLIVTPEGRVSLGRKRKRFIRSMVHRNVRGELSATEVGTLGGMIAFALSAEPNFVASLQRKFGDAAVNSLLHRVKINQA